MNRDDIKARQAVAERRRRSLSEWDAEEPYDQVRLAKGLLASVHGKLRGEAKIRTQKVFSDLAKLLQDISRR